MFECSLGRVREGFTFNLCSHSTCEVHSVRPLYGGLGVVLIDAPQSPRVRITSCTEQTKRLQNVSAVFRPSSSSGIACGVFDWIYWTACQSKGQSGISPKATTLSLCLAKLLSRKARLEGSSQNWSTKYRYTDRATASKCARRFFL